jgi:hypothetical protein
MHLTKLNEGQKKKLLEIMITSYGIAIYRKVSIFIKVYQLTKNFEVCKKSITKITLRTSHILVVILQKKKILSSLL